MTATKFGRNYRLTCTSDRFPIDLEIGLPFTLEFDIVRNSYATTNTATLRIYNLNKYHRNQLTHDQWDASLANAIHIELQAGYGVGPIWPIVFKGNTTRAWSVREGTNYVTTLECFDGGLAYANASSSRTFSSGQLLADVYEALISDLLPYGVSRGAVSAGIVRGALAKGQAFVGSTLDLLRDLSNNNFFIDNLAANVLGTSDAVGGNLSLNAQSGLLNTPVKENQWLLFDMLFEPRLVVGSVVNIDSISSNSTYNGQHKVASIHHKGMISDAVCGDAVTSLGVEGGIFTQVVGAAGLP